MRWLSSLDIILDTKRFSRGSWVQTTTNSAGFTNKCIKTIKIIMNVELWPKFMLSVKLVRLHVKPACPHKWLWDFLPLHSDLHLGVLVLVWVYLEALCLFVSSQQSLGWLLPKKKIPIKLTVITSLKNILKKKEKKRKKLKNLWE